MLQSESVYSKDYEIKYYEQNLRGDLKESSLLNFLQDIATLSAESLGFGPTFVFSNNYAWVVLKYHIELYKEMRNFESVIIKTQPRGTSKLYAFRDFELYKKDGELVGKAVSTWALIDMNSRRMLPASKVLPMMISFEKRDDDLEYNKIEPVETVTYSKEFEVRFDDIDVNRHANNCNYIIWALETLPQDFRLNHSPATIDIKYRKEVGLNGHVLSQVSQNGNTTVHVIRDLSDNEELCSVKIQWKK